MQDDCYLIAVDGWKAEPYRIIVTSKTGKETDKGWDCDLVPKPFVIDRYFPEEKKIIDKYEAQLEIFASTLKELEEDNGEGGIFEDYEKVNKFTVLKRLKELDALKAKRNKKEKAYNLAAEPDVEYETSSKELTTLKQYLKIVDDHSKFSILIKGAKSELDNNVLARYKTLTEDEIKQLVVDAKWMASIERSVKTEMERISQRLTQRIKELAERYEIPMPQQTVEVAELEAKVKAHLAKMGFTF